MKKTYHLCLSGSDEAIFRDLQDYNMGFNYFALALYKTDSIGLAESFMSTHTHQLVQTCDPRGFMYAFRQSYSTYFNHKYQREGRLAEENHFFAPPAYTADNAIGTALLCAKGDRNG